LSAKQIQEGGFHTEGFHDRESYVKAMHQLWDSSAKLSIVLSDFFKANRRPDDVANIFPSEKPLLRYCNNFARHARENSEVLPDNAYFIAAYAARELADLYRQNADYSTGSRTGELAFAYQLQAIEIFPLDIAGVLQLAYQSAQAGRAKVYFQYANPLASRLKLSPVPSRWLLNNDTEYNNLIDLTTMVVPQVMQNAFGLINHLQDTESTENGLFIKTILMTRLLSALQSTLPERDVNSLLSTIGQRSFDDGGVNFEDFGPVITAEMRSPLRGLSGLNTKYQFFKLKNELYGSVDSPLHHFIRELFYEIPYEKHGYVSYLGNMR
jgi:hypothetical protein